MIAFSDAWKEVHTKIEHFRVSGALNLTGRSKTIGLFIDTYQNFHNVRQQLVHINTEKILYNTSVSEILLDSSKGILALQTTYNLNVTELSNGDVAFQKNYIHRKYTHDKLTAKDLITLGIQAFEYNWYDTSILFLLEANQLLIQHKLLKRVEFLALQKLFNTVSSYHNEILLKVGSPIGINSKSFHRPVHIGILYAYHLFLS